MKKKSQTNINTERINAKKQLDRQKQRQKTIPLINKQKKIMLTDLCSEQKLKIGQLIKALQQKRKQNQQLTTQLSSITQKYHSLLMSYNQIEFKYQTKQRQLREVNQKIIMLEREVLQTNKQNLQILAIQEKQQQFIKECMQKQTKEQATSTKVISFSNVGVQTKKMKTKDMDIQAQCKAQSLGLMHKQHSKSFQKIMKGHWTLLQTTNTRSRNQMQNQHIYQRQWKTPNQISYSKAQQSYEVNQESQQSLDQSYQELARKWRQLKSKNPLITKNSSKSMKQSKQKISYQIPHQFRLKQQKAHAKHAGDNFTDLDEIYLNKMLKGKDFSISKLMNEKSSHRIQSSHSKSKDCKSPQMSNNIKKSPYFNYESQKGLANSHLNIEKKNILAYSDKSSKQDINFFQSDIIEIADSMKQM